MSEGQKSGTYVDRRYWIQTTFFELHHEDSERTSICNDKGITILNCEYENSSKMLLAYLG